MLIYSKNGHGHPAFLTGLHIIQSETLEHMYFIMFQWKNHGFNPHPPKQPAQWTAVDRDLWETAGQTRSKGKSGPETHPDCHHSRTTGKIRALKINLSRRLVSEYSMRSSNDLGYLILCFPYTEAKFYTWWGQIYRN